MIVVLTALEVEYRAVRDRLAGTRTHRHQAGTRFEVGSIAGSPGTAVALAATGIGNLSAATLTERAVAEFEPAALLFVGVAGGLRDWLQIGDVVVGTKVYAYHGGRSEDRGFRTRPRSWEIAHEIEQAARHLSRTREWRAGIPGEPEVHFDPIAAGDVVLDSRRSPHARQLNDSFNDAIAVEMESAGFAHAGHLNRRVPTAAIRGISDYADGTKDKTDNARQQPIAAHNAAAFALSLAALIDEDGAAKPKRGPDIPDLPPIRNTNIARGNARVGQQNGINFGDYRVRRTGEDS